MANPNPTYRFQKGETTNPNGRPKVPEEIKAARKLTQIELERIFNKYIHLNLTQLKEALKDPTSTTLDLMIGKIIALSIEKGDQIRLDFLLNRLIGKVSDRVINTHQSTGNVDALVQEIKASMSGK